MAKDLEKIFDPSRLRKNWEPIAPIVLEEVKKEPEYSAPLQYLEEFRRSVSEEFGSRGKNIEMLCNILEDFLKSQEQESADEIINNIEDLLDTLYVSNKSF